MPNLNFPWYDLRPITCFLVTPHKMCFRPLNSSVSFPQCSSTSIFFPREGLIWHREESWTLSYVQNQPHQYTMLIVSPALHGGHRFLTFGKCQNWREWCFELHYSQIWTLPSGSPVVPFPDDLPLAKGLLEIREERPPASQIPVQQEEQRLHLPRCHCQGSHAPGKCSPFGVPLAILWLWCWAPAKVGTQSKSKQNVFFRVGLTSLECSSQLFLCSLGCSLEASCHPKQGLKCQNHQSQVTALSCDDESIWEIWIWQSFSIWQVRLWLSFLSLERAWCQLNWLMTHPLLPSTSGWASRAAVRRWIF